MIYCISKLKKIFPTNILSSLVNHNVSVTAFMTEVIADIKCQIHHLHLKQFFIKQQKKTIVDIYVSICVPLLKLSYIFWEISKGQHSMLDNTDNKNIYIHKYHQ